MPPSSRRLRIDVLTPNIGAELSGVDLNTDLDAYLAEEIYAALIKHKVIFFRDQDLAPEAHLKLAKAFGEPEPPHPVYPHLPKYPRVTVLKSGGGTVPDTADWHKDMTFRENPPFTSILHAVKVPPTGGDTLWMDAHAAYEALPPGWKLMLDGLDAIHDIGTFRNDFLKKGGVSAVNEALKETGSAVHKVVGTHPVTGEKFLDVNTSFTRHIVGLVQGESDRVLQFLFQHLARPDFQVRFRWRNNSLAIWDNRITQHYAVCDYLPARRHMQRITVLNDKRAPPAEPRLATQFAPAVWQQQEKTLPHGQLQKNSPLRSAL